MTTSTATVLTAMYYTLTRWNQNKNETQFTNVIFEIILLKEISLYYDKGIFKVFSWWGHFCDKSTLVQIMAWTRRDTDHSLNQCWPIPLTYLCIIIPQRINTLFHRPYIVIFADVVITNLGEYRQHFSWKKMSLKMSSAKHRPFDFDFNVLRQLS